VSRAEEGGGGRGEQPLVLLVVQQEAVDALPQSGIAGADLIQKGGPLDGVGLLQRLDEDRLFLHARGSPPRG
jgi:hypothetical protein